MNNQEKKVFVSHVLDYITETKDTLEKEIPQFQALVQQKMMNE